MTRTSMHPRALRVVLAAALTGLLLAAVPSAALATHANGTTCATGRELDMDATWLAAPGESRRTFEYRIIRDTIPSEISATRAIKRIRGAVRYWNEGRNNCHFGRFRGFFSAYNDNQDASAANHTDGNSTIDFTSDPSCDRSGVVACTYRRLRDPRVYANTEAGPMPTIREADIRFNSDEDWHAGATQRGCQSEYDLKGVAAHEVGHAVGLDDLFDFPSSPDNSWQTMWAFVDTCSFRYRVLGRSDFIGLQQLYTEF